MDKKILKLTDVNGIEKEYEILMFFKWFKTNRNYIIYTDNTENEDGELNILASIYYPNNNSLDLIETDEEWDLIEQKLKELKEG